MKDEEIFINYINDHYDLLKNRYKRFCQEKDYKFDEDVFSDTIVKCYDAIKRKGMMEDTTPQGIENYFFMSYKINMQREKQYARIDKRDSNYTTEEVNQLYEDFYNEHNDSSQTKLKNDLFIDFATLYLMTKVEDNFDEEHFYLFRIKSLCNLTYKQLQQKTGIRSARQKVLNVKNWLKENVTKDEINEAFQQMYGNLI